MNCLSWQSALRCLTAKCSCHGRHKSRHYHACMDLHCRFIFTFLLQPHAACQPRCYPRPTAFARKRAQPVPWLLKCSVAPGDNLYPLFGPGRTVVAHKAAPGDGLRPLSGNHTRKSGATWSERTDLSAHTAMGQGTGAAGQTVLSEQQARCLTGPVTQGAAISISGLAITWRSHKQGQGRGKRKQGNERTVMVRLENTDAFWEHSVSAYAAAGAATAAHRPPRAGQGHSSSFRSCKPCRRGTAVLAEDAERLTTRRPQGSAAAC